MKVKFREISRISVFGIVASYLVACQGSNLGNSLQGVIAPASPSTPEAIAVRSNEPTLTTTLKPEPTNLKPTNSPSSSPTFLNSDDGISSTYRLADQMIAIGLQSLTTFKTEKNSQKNSLNALFYIDFANSRIQTNEFSDLETAPAPLRDWIKDLNQLGTIAPKTGQQFQPNILVARREYARWLLQTNNRLYKNLPSRQIRLAQSTDASSFPDIPSSHPDFTIIQGLANAGLIGGTGDRFRPNDPLLREELVQWKIPLDLRQPLPSATLETVSQSWGFKDSDRISENALSAIFADAQLRDISNIRRSFGFTTLLQPQKPVTRAEAAASLWYFGTATDGISARKVLDLEK